ncbi:MAG: hypothetical protein ACO1SV_26765 [Fimbriimonas sp.]
MPQTTGRNGYEEYVRAAALASHPDVEKWVYLDLAGGKRAPAPKDLAADATVLERNRWVLDRLKPAFDLVRQGNGKPVSEPRAAIGLSTILPEFAPFSHLGRAFAGAAYAEYAAGQTARGTERLLDGLTFGDNVSRTGLLAAHLMGTMQMNVIFSAFEPRLPQLSQADCRRVIAGTTDLLERPSPYPAILASEREIYLKALEGLVAGDSGSDEEGNYREITDRFKTLSPSQREEVRRIAAAKLRVHFEREIRKYRLPESQWPLIPAVDEADADEVVDSPQGLADHLVRQLTPSRTAIGVASLRARTQLRLLRLHARILAFRWEHERLPTRLRDVVSAPEEIDPVNDEPFEYVVTPEGYRLVSRGRAGLGEIALRYVRPSPTGGQDAAPPSVF